jgi:hypothetical protein
VRWKIAEEGDTISWPASDWSIEESTVTGGTYLRYQPETTREVELAWRHIPVADLTLARPRGYLVLAGWPQIEDLILGHDLRASSLAEDTEIEVETIRLRRPEFADSSYQGIVMVKNFEVARQRERRALPAGSLWIPADQPSFEVAVQLFEPESPDSIVRWGMVSSVFERKTHIGLDRLEKLAHDMMDDGDVRREWEKALQDPDFAANREARYLWWYRRTPYWDETVGLLPVMRVMGPVTLELEPWPRP